MQRHCLLMVAAGLGVLGVLEVLFVLAVQVGLLHLLEVVTCWSQGERLVWKGWEVGRGLEAQDQ